MMKCKKCLLSEFNKDEYFKSILDYIAAIPAEDKVSEELYKERLSICKTCDNLMNGMCIKCGCYVELRAAKIFMNCPCEKRLW